LKQLLPDTVYDEKCIEYDEQMMSVPENFEVRSTNELNWRWNHKEERDSYDNSSPPTSEEENWADWPLHENMEKVH